MWLIRINHDGTVYAKTKTKFWEYTISQTVKRLEDKQRDGTTQHLLITAAVIID